MIFRFRLVTTRLSHHALDGGPSAVDDVRMKSVRPTRIWLCATLDERCEVHVAVSSSRAQSISTLEGSPPHARR